MGGTHTPRNKPSWRGRKTLQSHSSIHARSFVFIHSFSFIHSFALTHSFIFMLALIYLHLFSHWQTFICPFILICSFSCICSHSFIPVHSFTHLFSFLHSFSCIHSFVLIHLFVCSHLFIPMHLFILIFIHLFIYLPSHSSNHSLIRLHLIHSLIPSFTQAAQGPVGFPEVATEQELWREPTKEKHSAEPTAPGRAGTIPGPLMGLPPKPDMNAESKQKTENGERKTKAGEQEWRLRLQTKRASPRRRGPEHLRGRWQDPEAGPREHQRKEKEPDREQLGPSRVHLGSWIEVTGGDNIGGTSPRPDPHHPVGSWPRAGAGAQRATPGHPRAWPHDVASRSWSI